MTPIEAIEAIRKLNEIHPHDSWDRWGGRVKDILASVKEPEAKPEKPLMLLAKCDYEESKGDRPSDYHEGKWEWVYFEDDNWWVWRLDCHTPNIIDVDEQLSDTAAVKLWKEANQ